MIRLKYSINHEEQNFLTNASSRHGRSRNSSIRLAIIRSTHNFTDFSIVDKEMPIANNIGDRYRFLQAHASFNKDQADAIKREADMRDRSISSMIYIILYHATKGFTDLSVVDGSNHNHEEE